MKKFLFYIITSVIITSCAVYEAEPALLKHSDNTTQRPSTKAVSVFKTRDDSLMQIHKIQTRKDAILFDRIAMKDSVYYLSISKEEASYMGIPEPLYEFVLQCVDNANKKTNHKW